MTVILDIFFLSWLVRCSILWFLLLSLDLRRECGCRVPCTDYFWVAAGCGHCGSGVEHVSRYQGLMWRIEDRLGEGEGPQERGKLLLLGGSADTLGIEVRVGSQVCAGSLLQSWGWHWGICNGEQGGEWTAPTGYPGHRGQRVPR